MVLVIMMVARIVDEEFHIQNMQMAYDDRTVLNGLYTVPASRSLNG